MTMPADYPQHRKLGPFLLAISLAAWLLGLLSPEFAWPLAAIALVAASLFIRALGIRFFLVICGVAIAHFVTLVPAPYGRGELPFDFMLRLVIVPFTVASGAIAVWCWRERGR